ncbi:hypothetical protein J6590_025394 [Homalodisca vitripennis]|nr:hypothetical protein J6590_025394 [Homalodisca vitripennis]
MEEVFPAIACLQESGRVAISGHGWDLRKVTLKEQSDLEIACGHPMGPHFRYNVHSLHP